MISVTDRSFPKTLSFWVLTSSLIQELCALNAIRLCKKNMIYFKCINIMIVKLHTSSNLLTSFDKRFTICPVVVCPIAVLLRQRALGEIFHPWIQNHIRVKNPCKYKTIQSKFTQWYPNKILYMFSVTLKGMLHSIIWSEQLRTESISKDCLALQQALSHQCV